MGNCCGNIFRRRNQRRHIVLILIGLDNAGKTKTVNNLAGEKDDKVLPTVGFKAVNLVHKDTPVTIYDLGGGPHFRQIWSQYYSEVHGVIFVIDSSDFSRLDECRAVLEEVLSHDKISECVPQTTEAPLSKTKIDTRWLARGGVRACLGRGTSTSRPSSLTWQKSREAARSAWTCLIALNRRSKPILVLANKQDKTGALDDIDVVEKLNIEPLVNKYRCPTLVESYSAFTINPKTKKLKIDPGLRKGYHWLLNYIVRRYGDINLRVQTDIHAELERRKRMQNKASNTTLQTFTAVSDEIATQTGFENPNYDLDKSTKIDSDDLHTDGLIIVKPISHNPNSIDSTITIESVEDSDGVSTAKPKLSPLFGRASNSTVETVRIELEPRSEFRKLSPIVRNKSSANQHIDFKNRPQSSPTFRKKKLGPSLSSQNSSLQDEEMKPDGDLPYIGDRNLTWDVADKKETVLINAAELSQMHREIVLNERDYNNKTACSEVTLQAATLPLSPRPASASQLVRRQLELCSQHKRRLSLRYMQRNKTSPERVSMLIYEPKAPQRHLDKGDFSHSATIN
ncbi:unnamed protein product [Arctia plantaginis]|uniref:ADP-ribosylation factor-like protein 13B n=1 Tax=Arctia plantaginis TaxID=874455 RepID=A0A8S1AR77_ARCPL|nr:unnamed protein product [Arctia plantaginis]